MAVVQPVVRVEIDPTKPVQEICDVITAIAVFHPGQEAVILCKLQEAIDKRLEELAKQKEDSSVVK